MDIVIFAILLALFVIWLWLNALATLAVWHDVTLEHSQKVAQIVIIWLVPFLGGAFVLHLVWEQYPDAIPKAWVPWPFKRMIFGEAPRLNPNRDKDSWILFSGGENHRHNDGGFGGGDGGGGD